MFRATLRTLSSAPARVTAESRSRGPRRSGRVLALAVAVAGAGTAYAITRPGETQLEESPLDTSPGRFWKTPTRAQMLDALRRSSTDMLPGGQAEKDALMRLEHETPGTSPSPEAQSTGHTAPRSGGGYDLLVVGGGATGAGVVLDAATRGLKVALVERDDYAAGTSSKSTKLVHGGVRYLQKAVMQLDYDQYKMVREALHERRNFLHIAPYLSEALPILIPAYTWWKLPYYWIGTKLYDIIAGSENMQSSYMLGRSKALEAFPMLRSAGLSGAVVYYDGQQNDARMNMALILTAIHHGAVAVNHTEVVALNKGTPGPDGVARTVGARVRDRLTGDEFDVQARGVVNATGPFCDAGRKMDDQKVQPIVMPASGVHITFPGYLSPRNMGLLDPATSDGRVVFFLPWNGATIAGTTDSAARVEPHPVPGDKEVEWIIDEVRGYLTPEITISRKDVLSAWSGLRPLVSDPDAVDTQSLVRNHMINVSRSGLLTIAGGKWTTYREMAEQTVDRAIQAFGLTPQRGCMTKRVRLVGTHGWSKTLYLQLLQEFGLDPDVAMHLSSSYGDRAWSVCALAKATGHHSPRLGVRLDPHLPMIEAEVRYATRVEYATKVADFIARRSNMTFLDTQATIEALPRVIDIMGEELNWNEKQRQDEFEEGMRFLLSMGVSAERVEKLASLKLVDARERKLGGRPVDTTI